MEQKETICLQPFHEIQVAPQADVKLAPEVLPEDALKVVIKTENYEIEIEIY